MTKAEFHDIRHKHFCDNALFIEQALVCLGGCVRKHYHETSSQPSEPRSLHPVNRKIPAFQAHHSRADDFVLVSLHCWLFELVGADVAI